MSIDRYYTQINGHLERIDKPGDEHGQVTDFWVDISGGLADERYYFTDLASTLEFYLGDWRTRRLVTEEDGEGGGERLGLYSRRRLIHGLSIHGDAPDSKGEKLEQILEAVVRKLEAEHP